MEFNTYRFSKESNAEFASILKFRVNEYFRVNNINKDGGWQMPVKTTVMLLVYAIPFGVILSGIVTNTWGFLGLWVIMGMGTAGLGLNVMHDAIHGAYSQNVYVNKLMSLIMNIIGGHAEIWRLQHNVLHHSFTNIAGGDEDIFVTPILRFSPNQKLMAIHRFQHIYAWFLYSLMTLSKLTFNDMSRAFRYRNMGLIKTKKALLKIVSDIALWKVIYVTYTIIIPILVLPISPWLILIGFLIMHLVTGLLLSLVFQSAHVMPECEFPLPDEEGKLDTNFVVHQLSTTTNFAPKNKFLSWAIGGLNYQVEHHLFPTISHIHYGKISKIVSATAREFGIQYNSQKSFVRAIRNHGKMLLALSKNPVQELETA